MKNLKNQIQLIGRLGANPEVKSFGDNRKVAHLVIATSESYRNAKGENVSETQWHRLVCWDRQATQAEKFLSKGKQVVVVGKLNSRSYENKQGQKQYITEVIVDQFLLLDKKEQEN